MLIRFGIIAAVLALIVVGILTVFRGCLGGAGIGLFGGGGGPGPGDGSGTTDSGPTKTDGVETKPKHPDPTKKPDDKTPPHLVGVQVTPDGVVMNIRIVDTRLEFDGRTVSTEEFRKEIESVAYKHPGKTVRVIPHPADNAKTRTLAELSAALKGMNVIYKEP
jgi:hypothetical protein